MRFGWVEPVEGLFHLQMNVLKMLMHDFDGGPAGQSFGVRRFTSMLRRQGVSVNPVGGVGYSPRVKGLFGKSRRNPAGGLGRGGTKKVGRK